MPILKSAEASVADFLKMTSTACSKKVDMFQINWYFNHSFYKWKKTLSSKTRVVRYQANRWFKSTWLGLILFEKLFYILWMKELSEKKEIDKVICK